MELICVESSVYIEYHRSRTRELTFLSLLAARYGILVPVVVRYELLCGGKQPDANDRIWLRAFSEALTLNFDARTASIAAGLYRSEILRGIRHNEVRTKDLFIAALALANELPLATHNEKDFRHFAGLRLITKTTF